MSSNFIHNDFLLQTNTAKYLYHQHAAQLPIIDYHNHLLPQQIAGDINFETITDIWLMGDHYKWRAMRANGVNEKFITGNSNNEEKFIHWAATVPFTMRNPLYHWSHLELKRYFGVDELLNEKNAKTIYTHCNELLQKKEFSVRSLLHKMNVEVLCTTDDPCDSLEHHRLLKESNCKTKVLPAFRPDKAIIINTGFAAYIQQLATVSGIAISSIDDLLQALQNRIDYFHNHGCRISDHGLNYIPAVEFSAGDIKSIFTKAINQHPVSATEANQYLLFILQQLGKMYYAKNWTMQLHLGAIRNNNQRLQKLLGADCGADSIGDFQQAAGLSALLNYLDSKEQLPQTILYNLNSADNEVFATMAGNYNDGNSAGKIQWGSSWWFLDQKDGMEKQLNTLSNMGLLSRFIGMLTDSRSFMSFPRHEYFRRILCNVIGNDVEDGLIPSSEMDAIGKMVENICYNNAKHYFNF
jgi:glucuronate isomerase